MKYALIADIHSNREALDAVLSAIDAEGIGRVLCLGDIVGYGADPEPCLSILQQRDIPSVRGNHDAVAAGLRGPVHFGMPGRLAIAWTRRQLSRKSIAALSALPILRIVDDRLVLVHASLHPRPNDSLRIRDEQSAQPTLAAIRRHCPTANICIVGHTHRAEAYQLLDGAIQRFTGSVVDLHPAATYLINPGSVGQPRDADWRAAFALLDLDRGTLHFRRVEYDRQRALDKARRAGLLRRPTLLARSQAWMADHADLARHRAGQIVRKIRRD